MTDVEKRQNGPEKRTFVILLAVTFLLLLITILLAYIVPYYGLSSIHADLPRILGIIFGLLGGSVLLVLILLMVVTLLGHDVPCSQKMRSFAVKWLLPLLVGVGRLVGLKREQVQHSFVAVNNEWVLAQCRNGHPVRNILLLMPHCLQDQDCGVKITHRVENCKRCGKCPIKNLLELADTYGVELAVATGGTIARRIVLEKRPDLIIAVACERDLTSGIQDTTPLPVYGIFNERPFGPCLNTRVAVDRVERVLREFASMNREMS